MKAVFITYGQSLTEPVESLLDKLHIRGFTRWSETQGRGSETGEPHYGSHAWPSKNGSLLTIVDDEQAEKILVGLRLINEQADEQGLNAFVWTVDGKM
ncbi:MAG: hypothetical protein LBS94_04245 [Prevotellaceae bacterium]|jgi:hypothetical protein|nr:hypothetical protein [Prevotellaceae bacterium]